MKKAYLLFTIILISGCSLFQKDNPDENFEEFYQGGPDTDNTQTGSNSDSQDKITIFGEDNGYKCTVVCEKE